MDWLCDALGWFCADHGEYVTHAGAPEIDGTLLLLVVAIVAGGVAIIQRRGR